MFYSTILWIKERFFSGLGSIIRGLCVILQKEARKKVSFCSIDDLLTKICNYKKCNYIFCISEL